MTSIENEQQNFDPGSRSRRRDTLRSLGAGMLALLVGGGSAGADRTEAATANRRKHGSRGNPPPTLKKVEGTPFTVEAGGSADGLAFCGNNSDLAISGGLTQTNADCWLAQSSLGGEQFWGVTVGCPAGGGSSTVTPFVICVGSGA